MVRWLFDCKTVCLHIGEVGITPESKSFKDDGFCPPPARWKGTCGHYANFSGCNK